MKFGKKIVGEAAVLLIAAILIGSSAVIANTTTAPVAKKCTIERTISMYSAADEEVIFFYDINTFPFQGIGLQGGTPPYQWKTAIRCTPDELAQYAGWNVTAVNIYHGEDAFTHEGDVEIYAEGSVAMPGTLITSEPYYFDLSQWYRVDLTTPVPITGDEDIWAAIHWSTDNLDYPAMQDGSPAIRDKGDYVYMNSAWQQMYTFGADFDHNWGMEVVVEGEGTIWTDLSIADPTGPIGVSSSITNNGENPATNVVYEFTVTGGILGMINKNITGTVAELAIGAEEPLSSGLIIGLGSIDISIFADADNADPKTKTKTGFVLGPLVLKIQ
jgi:hypothetical protein